MHLEGGSSGERGDASQAEVRGGARPAAAPTVTPSRTTVQKRPWYGPQVRRPADIPGLDRSDAGTPADERRTADGAAVIAVTTVAPAGGPDGPQWTAAGPG